MGKNRRIKYPVNDVNQCIVRARNLVKVNHTKYSKNSSLHRIFVTLTGDEEIGWIAFAIWKGRSDLLSLFRSGYRNQSPRVERFS